MRYIVGLASVERGERGAEERSDWQPRFEFRSLKLLLPNDECARLRVIDKLAFILQ